MRPLDQNPRELPTARDTFPDDQPGGLEVPFLEGMQEVSPTFPVLSSCFGHPEDLPVSFLVDTDGYLHVHVPDQPVLGAL